MQEKQPGDDVRELLGSDGPAGEDGPPPVGEGGEGGLLEGLEGLSAEVRSQD